MKTWLALWHLALRTDHLEKSLEAAVDAGCEVAVAIRPLDLLNKVTQKPWPVHVAFFRGPDGELIELLEDKTGYTRGTAETNTRTWEYNGKSAAIRESIVLPR